MFEIFGIPSTALFGQLLLGLINGSFYALLSLGLAVIFGMLNIINFAHGALYMLGAFIGYLLLVHLGIGYWPALMSRPVIGHINVAYLFALSQFAMAWLLMAVYVRRARRYDRMAEAFVQQLKERA